MSRLFCSILRFGPDSATHGHKDRDVIAAIVCGDENWRIGIVESDLDLGILSMLIEHVEKIACVEADIEFLAAIFGFDFFCRDSEFRTGDGQQQFVGFQRDLDRTRALARDRRYAVDALGESVSRDPNNFVILGRDDAAVVREGSVDQFAGDDRVSERESDLACRDFDEDIPFDLVDDLEDFADRFARNDNPLDLDAAGLFGMNARQSVTIGGNRQKGSIQNMEIDPVEVVSRFFCRYGVPGAAEHVAELLCRHFEGGRKLAGDDERKIFRWKDGQIESRAACLDREVLTIEVEVDRRAVWQFSHDLIEGVCGDRGLARLFDLGRQCFGGLDIQIRRSDGETVGRRIEKHVCEDWNGVPALNDGLDVSEGTEQRSTLNAYLHKIPLTWDDCRTLTKSGN